MAGLKTWANADDPMVVLRRRLEVVVGKKDEIISVSFVSPYPEEAAQVVNTVIGSYIAAHEQRTRTTLGEVVRILKEEKTKRNEDLLSKLQKMTEFKQHNEGLALAQTQTITCVRQLEPLASVLRRPACTLEQILLRSAPQDGGRTLRFASTRRGSAGPRDLRHHEQ
jgi:hypothetical protein